MKWFKHDSNANRDPKLEKVLMKYGADGYALYWLCIELIAEPIDGTRLTFELEHDAEILAYRLKIDSLVVEEIMKFMVSIGLFEFNKTTERITCLKLANRLENSIVKNPELKKVQAILKENPGLSGKTSDRIEENRIDKNRIEIDDSFNIFWSIYPKKASKKDAYKAYSKAYKSNILPDNLLEILQKWCNSESWKKENGKFIPYPATWINGERWNDEIAQLSIYKPKEVQTVVSFKKI